MKKEKSNDLSTLGGRMKSYEKLYETKVSEDCHIVCRIDGHKFSSFTKGFKKPFDSILSEAMILTTRDLVERYGAYTGYTQSDEITLFIPSLSLSQIKESDIEKETTHIFGGRVQKIASLVSSYTTMRFNHWLYMLAKKAIDATDDRDWYDYCSMIMETKAGEAYFDARVYGVHSDEEVFNSFLWRHRDCIKNSKSMFSHTYCGHKKLLNLNGEEQIALCLETTGNDWNAIEPRYKYGTFVKRELYEKYDEVYKTNVTRSKIVLFNTDTLGDDLLSKYKV